MKPNRLPEIWRKTTQELMPALRPPSQAGHYDIYPAASLAPGLIRVGFSALAESIAALGTVVIDGYPGVFWDHFHSQLAEALDARGIRAHFTNVAEAMLAPEQIELLVSAYLGGDDPLFGYRYPGELVDFFDKQRLENLNPDPQADLNVLYGCGAALAGWQASLMYVDVPKNEIQFRARARAVKNLGAAYALDSKQSYKRSYFVDWPTANKHKAAILPRLAWFVDEQRPDNPTFMSGSTLRSGLNRMAHSFFRARPWFEPGPWGGQWIKANVSQLNQQVPNYAWSFELIAPENGLLFQSDDLMLEIPFDTLMFQEYQAVLGDSSENFRIEFPIRYDFLDTMDGGNLSIQVHPRPEYIRSNFGETFTQDECYYILDCVPDAHVNLGFQQTIDPQKFQQALIDSDQTGEALEMESFVQVLPASKHDLFLIPNGTIHGSGIGNLVLEISATPYIFTFKMYDWLRMDLDGKPRILNIERAFQNLYFDRKGERIREEFVSSPKVLSQGAMDDGTFWRVVHLPTHANHFYDVHRLEFNGSIDVDTVGSCHVLSLVEGQTVRIETTDGSLGDFHYAETFIVPAAAKRYRLTSLDRQAISVVKTFIKPASQWAPGVVPGARQS
jgi:mannose-6-phosphate isomerase class I